MSKQPGKTWSISAPIMPEGGIFGYAASLVTHSCELVGQGASGFLSSLGGAAMGTCTMVGGSITSKLGMFGSLGGEPAAMASAAEVCAPVSAYDFNIAELGCLAKPPSFGQVGSGVGAAVHMS